MNRRSFYEVPERCWLWGRTTDQSQPKEETVRQWCAFELIRAYGYPIDDLRFEHRVRVGSKIYRIDIAVFRDGELWAVVECKKPDSSKHQDSLEQALSYANAEDIQAEYAVYTNGTTWHVRRRLGGQWLAVPDLPRFDESPRTRTVRELYLAFVVVAPLLANLDCLLEGTQAQQFLEDMQVFFHSGCLLMVDLDRELWEAMDNLMRAISAVPEHLNYRLGKLQVARNAFEKYRLRTGVGIELSEVGYQKDLRMEFQYLWSGLQSFIEGSKGLTLLSVHCLEVAIAALAYAIAVELADKQLPRMDGSLPQALRKFLNFAFQSTFEADLPKQTDLVSVADLQSYCRGIRLEYYFPGSHTSLKIRVRDLFRRIFHRR